MDLAQTFLSEIFVIFGYALLGAAVYKLFQIGAELGEIKALLQKSTRNASLGPAVSSTVSPAVSSAGDDSATEYAEKLLRSLQAESAHSESASHKAL